MKCIYEQRAVISPPFPITLSHNTTAEVGRLTMCKPKYGCGCLMVTAVVNWSAIFTPPENISATLCAGGYVDIVIELLHNNNVIYRVFQTAMQKSIPISPTLFSNPATTCDIATLLHSNPLSCCCSPCCYCETISLNATAKIVAPLVNTGTATATANVGAVTLIAEIVDMHRIDEDRPDVVIIE